MQTTNGSDSSLATPGGTTPPPPQQWQQQQQQQHWMAAMQYPGAAAMMMMQQQQQMMMYPHQYVPYNYQQHPQFQYASYHQQQEHKTHERGSGDDVKTLWIGDLLHWMDETYLHTCFSHTGEVCTNYYYVEVLVKSDIFADLEHCLKLKDFFGKFSFIYYLKLC